MTDKPAPEAPNKPTPNQPLTYEQMTDLDRELYGPRRSRGSGLPEAQGLEYDPIERFMREIRND